MDASAVAITNQSGVKLYLLPMLRFTTDFMTVVEQHEGCISRSTGRNMLIVLLQRAIDNYWKRMPKEPKD
jgi:hypothetical protein